MTENELLTELLRLVIPKEIVEYFELKQILEKSKEIVLILEEYPTQIPEELKDKNVVLDGFLNELSFQTFPLKDKTVYIAIRRRRWKEKGVPQKSYSNQYDFHITGMKTTKEQGKRILNFQDIFQILFVPSCLKSLAFQAYF